MKKGIVVLGIVICGAALWGQSQSLGSERVKMLRESCVRILIDSVPCGTGFFVNEFGWVATSFHVIEPAIMVQNKIIRVRKIEMELFSGEIVEILIHKDIIQKRPLDAKGHDFAILGPKTPIKSIARFLPLGSSDDVQEGEEVYTAGYPLGIKPQIISKGIVSTIDQHKIEFKGDGLKDTSITSKVAYLDMTLNKGNSGGPIIRIGNSPEEDVVIGIATFILNPYAGPSQELLKLYNNQRGFTIIDGLDQSTGTKLALEAIINNSIGVSGMYFIDYVKSMLPQR